MSIRYSYHIYFSALLLLLAACTQDELTDDTRLPEGQYPLQIAAVTLSVEEGEAQPWGTPQTRVSESGDGTGSEFSAGDRFAVQINGEEGIYIVQDMERHRRTYRHRLVPRHGRHPRPQRPKPKSCLPAGRLGHGRLPDTRHADLHPLVGQGAHHAFGRCTR